MALMVNPLDMVITSGGSTSADYPASFAGMDQPSLTWQGATSGTFYADFQPSGSFDTIALMGCNLMAGDTVTIAVGPNQSSNATYGATVTFDGVVPDGCSAKFIHQLPATYSNGWIRIKLNKVTNTNTNWSVQRVVVGKSLPFGDQAGVEIGAEQTFLDKSIITNGAGWRTVEKNKIVPEWKVVLTMIEADDFAQSWHSFFSRVGKSKGILFAPQVFDPSRWQAEAIFGAITSDAKSAYQSSGTRRVELTIEAFDQ